MTIQKVKVAQAVAKALHIALSHSDAYTAMHSSQVGDLSYTVAIGQLLGMSYHDCDGLRTAGYLHDIGKLAIPTELLTKSGPLVHEEIELMRTHACRGYEILKHVEWPWPIADVAHQHHERLDGSGYPNGLVGDEICYFAKIIAVTDLVDAMTAHRPYRKAQGWDAAKSELLNGQGILYDSDIVDAAIESMILLNKHK